jgi:hypothetical protein
MRERAVAHARDDRNLFLFEWRFFIRPVDRVMFEQVLKDDGQCPDSSSPVRVLFDEQFEAIATPSIRTVSYQSAQQLVMPAITRMHVHVGGSGDDVPPGSRAILPAVRDA